MAKFSIGLLVGRFQPFHKGHVYLIKEAVKHVDHLVIGIGTPNILDTENPFSFEVRKKMVETVFEKEGIQDKLLKIVEILDVPDDDEWLQIVKKTVGEFDVGIGQNEWTNSILEKAGYTVLRFTYYKRYVFEGKKIRERMREGKEWKDRIPTYLHEFLI